LKGDESLRMKHISLHNMQALLEADDVYGMYEVYSFSMVPTTLPPHRIIDHRMHLLPNTKPVNVRPYRYPHYQKSKMEKLVKEMMEQGYWASNEVMIKDKFSIPTVDEIFDEKKGQDGSKENDGGYGMACTYNATAYPWILGTCRILSAIYQKICYCCCTIVLSSSKTGFQWGDIENKAFQDLKVRLSEAPILGLPNFEDMFIVEADASNVGIWRLAGTDATMGKPLSYFHPIVGSTDCDVATTYSKRAIRNCGKKQIIQTPLQQKYMRKLMGFDFSIEYKTEATNLVANVLSRVYDEADDVIAAFMALSQSLVSLIDDLRKENEMLDELKVIHQKLKRKEVLDGFQHEQGMILFHDRYFISVESKLKELLLSEFHNMSMAGHSGVKKMLVGMSALFYWKGMRKSIEDFIRKCLVCQQTKYSTQALAGLLQPLLTPSGVWEDVSMDFITGLPVCKGLSIILVVVDHFTKYAHFETSPASFNAPKVAEVFMNIVVKYHGIPKTIVSDRDPNFVSKFWKKLFEASGIKLNHSTAYHPQTDEQTKVVNRGLE
ncbi:ty3-gypsy retrotransposon protein, partial [Tanacetum coccineum]